MKGTESVKRIKIHKRDKGLCYICFRKVSVIRMSLDHFHPRFDGGSGKSSNLKCCCRNCNNKKAVIEYCLSRDFQPNTKTLNTIVKAYSYYKNIVIKNRASGKKTIYALDTESI